MVQRAGVVELVTLVGDVLHPPALVQWHPGDDAGVGDVTPDDVDPLPGHPFHCSDRKLVGAGVLSPHEKTDPVGPVQIARVFNLFVHPDGVESKVLGQLDLVPQCQAVGCGQMGIWPVALLEHGPDVVRTVVEHEMAAGEVGAAQTEVGADHVNRAVVPPPQRSPR